MASGYSKLVSEETMESESERSEGGKSERGRSEGVSQRGRDGKDTQHQEPSSHNR